MLSSSNINYTSHYLTNALWIESVWKQWATKAEVHRGGEKKKKKYVLGFPELFCVWISNNGKGFMVYKLMCTFSDVTILS